MRIVVMRGMTGAGKSTLTKRLFKDALVCSADDFFPAGVYDPRRLDEAHDYCYNRFQAGLKAKTQTIVVDNTNLKSRDYEPYVLDALDHEAQDITFYHVLCHPMTAAHRSKHWRFLKRQGPGPMWKKHFQLLQPPDNFKVVEVWTSDRISEEELAQARYL